MPTPQWPSTLPLQRLSESFPCPLFPWVLQPGPLGRGSPGQGWERDLQRVEEPSETGGWEKKQGHAGPGWCGVPQGHLGLPASYVVGHAGFPMAPKPMEGWSVILAQGTLRILPSQGPPLKSMLALRVHTWAYMHMEPTLTTEQRDSSSCPGEKTLCSSAPALALLWGSLNNMRFQNSIQLWISMFKF